MLDLVDPLLHNRAVVAFESIAKAECKIAEPKQLLLSRVPAIQPRYPQSAWTCCQAKFRNVAP